MANDQNIFGSPGDADDADTTDSHYQVVGKSLFEQAAATLQLNITYEHLCNEVNKLYKRVLLREYLRLLPEALEERGCNSRAALGRIIGVDKATAARFWNLAGEEINLAAEDPSLPNLFVLVGTLAAFDLEPSDCLPRGKHACDEAWIECITKVDVLLHGETPDHRITVAELICLRVVWESGGFIKWRSAPFDLVKKRVAEEEVLSEIKDRNPLTKIVTLDDVLAVNLRWFRVGTITFSALKYHWPII